MPNLLDKYVPVDTRMTYVFAERNCANLIAALPAKRPITGRLFYYPIFIALLKGYHHAARALLGLDESSKSIKLVADLEYGEAVAWTRSQTPLL